MPTDDNCQLHATGEPPPGTENKQNCPSVSFHLAVDCHWETASPTPKAHTLHTRQCPSRHLLSPQQRFHFRPLPHGQRALRPTTGLLTRPGNGFPPVPADNTRNKKFLNPTPFGVQACNLFARERGISRSTTSKVDSRKRFRFALSQRVLYKRLQRLASPIFTICINHVHRVHALFIGSGEIWSLDKPRAGRGRCAPASPSRLLNRQSVSTSTDKE